MLTELVIKKILMCGDLRLRIIACSEAVDVCF
jgi:hypothetical protein